MLSAGAGSGYPNNRDAREQLALLLATLGRSDDAIAFFQSLTESDTPQSRFVSNLAVCCWPDAGKERSHCAISSRRGVG